MNPPEGVLFRVQRGKTDFENPDLLSAILATRKEIVFDFTVRIARRTPRQPPNFLGALVQGPRGGRFVYVNSGTLAGQQDSRWTRRAKIHLAAITWKQIDQVLAKPNRVLAASIQGTDGGGGPVCATVPPIRGWELARIRR